MTQHTLSHPNIHGAVTGRDPWWIPLRDAIALLFGAPAPAPDTAAKNLPSEVLRDYDPALHRALNAPAGGLDAGSRPMLY